MKKTTMATIKSFIKREKSAGRLFINVKSSFDGMIDCVALCNNGFTPITSIKECIHNQGIAGAWLVGSGRDYFEDYSDETFIGYRISNCCGSFILAFKR